MNGIINVYKPLGISSFDVVRKVKKVCNTKKVGHTGTLDPLACGVLPICIGSATKAVDYIMNDYKVYVAELKLGIITDTYDREGKILEENEVDLSQDEVKEAILSFVGKIDQVPPMYSALKVNGQKLYKLARAGIEIERVARPIEIFDIEILELKLPVAKIRIKCSKGTYIRSLCYDIGQKLKCGAMMWSLEREATGTFVKENSIHLDKLTEENVEQYLITSEKVFEEYPFISISERVKKLLLNGVSMKDPEIFSKTQFDIIYRVYYEDEFLGIASKTSKGFKLLKSFN